MLESFLYQYAVESLIFGFGIYCGVRVGVLAPSHPRGTRRLCWLIAGFLGLLALQGMTLVWGK